MANSVDPDQTAPVGAVCHSLGPHSLLQAYTLFVSNARQLVAADEFSRRYFQKHFFLGVLTANCFRSLSLKQLYR